MVRVEKVSVVAGENIKMITDFNEENGSILHGLDRYDLIVEGRLYRVRHWNGAAIPSELSGSFTSVQKIKEALASYYIRKGISDEQRSSDDSYVKPKQRGRFRRQPSGVSEELGEGDAESGDIG